MTSDRLGLPDGTEIRLRPVRPGDEERLKELLSHMSLADVRMRFFAPIRELAPPLAYHLSHPDPAREVALAALAGSGESFLGVGRIAIDETGRRGEFAIAIRTDMQGRGIGRRLMERLIEEARRRGLDALWGDVLHENEAMLRMARGFGFRLDAHPADPGLVRVVMPLAPGGDAVAVSAR